MGSFEFGEPTEGSCDVRRDWPGLPASFEAPLQCARFVRHNDEEVILSWRRSSSHCATELERS